MNGLIQNYLNGVEKGLADRAIEILDAEVERTIEAVEKFEAENPSVKIPRTGNVLEPGYCVVVRSVIRGERETTDLVQKTIADTQITKAIKERNELWDKVKELP